MLTFRSFFAVLVRPSLWATASGALFAMAPREWWKHPPFLPIPDADVVSWRVTTAYGHPNMTLARDDLLSYLRWRKRA